MSPADFARRLGNKLYRYCYPIYRPLYSLFKSYTDRTERALLRKILRPGSIVVDAGANIGIYSEFLARCVGPTGVVHSFEPDPSNCLRLRAALAGFSNARVNEAAVSNQTGTAVLYVSEKLNVDHRLYPSVGDGRRCVPIEAIKLDDYFQAGDRVDLIKLDIQGYEMHALRGAERVLKENAAIKLILEFWPYGLIQAGVNWKDLINYLQDAGMEVRQIARAGLDSFSANSVRDDPAWYLNLFAYRP